MFVLIRLLSLVLIVSLAPSHVWGRERLTGPISARIIKVIDGDSVRVRAFIWPGHTVLVTVRLLGIDTPEMRAKCASERRLAKAARTYLVQMLDGNRVTLRDIRFGKYAGRVLARMATADIADISELLLTSGHARPYAGRKRASWCQGKTIPAP